MPFLRKIFPYLLVALMAAAQLALEAKLKNRETPTVSQKTEAPDREGRTR